MSSDIIHRNITRAAVEALHQAATQPFPELHPDEAEHVRAGLMQLADDIGHGHSPTDPVTVAAEALTAEAASILGVYPPVALPDPAQTAANLGIRYAAILMCRDAGNLLQAHAAAQTQVDAWNTAHPAPTPVRYWPGTLDGPGQEGTTRAPAWLLGGHSPVVDVDDRAAIYLDHVIAVDEHEHAEAATPVTGIDLPERITVSTRGQDAPMVVAGVTVAPGLAITEVIGDHWYNPDHRAPARYQLVHVPSTLRVGSSRCPTHVRQVTDACIASGIDWTQAELRVAIEPRLKDLGQRLNAVGSLGVCPTWCEGDGPRPAPWRWRCTTCGYESFDGPDDVPFDADTAKEEAVEHVCESRVQIASPGGDWYDPGMPAKAGV